MNDNYKKLHNLYVTGQTDVGKKRDHNEDNFFIDEKINLMLVADGMGGHQAGEVASQIAVDTVRSYLRHHGNVEIQQEESVDLDATIDLNYDQPKTVVQIEDTESNTDAQLDNFATVRRIKRAVEEANRQIFAKNQENGQPEGYGMGTTVVGLWHDASSDTSVIFHVGDSRLYRFFNGELRQLTKDHSLYQAWLDSGSKGNPPRRNVIMRALGPSPEVDVDVNLELIEENALYLICSDGLTTHFDDEELVPYFERATLDNLHEICDELIAECNVRGGKDNITVILACATAS